jgi:hypothetical protein
MGIEPIHWVDTLLNDFNDNEAIGLVYLINKLDAYEVNAKGEQVYTIDEMRYITKVQEWCKHHSRDSRL